MLTVLSGGLASDLDVVAEGLQALDELAGGAPCVRAIEVVGAEVVEVVAGAEHVTDGDEELVRDGYQGVLVPSADPQAMKLLAEVAVLRPDGRLRRLDEGRVKCPLPARLVPL
jgi:hypothetical protein